MNINQIITAPPPLPRTNDNFNGKTLIFSVDCDLFALNSIMHGPLQYNCVCLFCFLGKSTRTLRRIGRSSILSPLLIIIIYIFSECKSHPKYRQSRLDIMFPRYCVGVGALCCPLVIKSFLHC